jgi:hypothetical protein
MRRSLRTGFALIALAGACQRGAKEPPPEVLARARSELEARGREDQRVREGFGSGGKIEPDQFNAMLRTDSSNTRWLKEYVAQWGWPTGAQVGPEAVEAAFLIVQHAVQDTGFMRAMLPAIQEGYRRGDYRGVEVALLIDRLEVKAGRPQIYGTQLSLKDGKLVLDPLSDSAGVDARRRQMGLGPLAEYLRKADSALRAP